MKYRILLPILFFATIISSCRMGRQYVRPEVYATASHERNDTSAVVSVANMQWWEIYTDTVLKTLIERTLENNKDIKIAVAKIEELAAANRMEFSQLFPQIDGNAYTQKEGLNYGGNNYTNDPESGIKLSVKWEADIWGNLRWANEKSKAQLLGSVEAQYALRISIISKVAEAYFELVALDNELAIVRQTLEARKEGARLAKIRFEGGLTSETSYQQAQVEYARTATLVPELEKRIAIKENEIAILSGEPHFGIEKRSFKSNIVFTDTIPMGLPSSLLERRPDIRHAEQRLIAANASVGVAYTNMFPRLNLTAQYGVESDEFSNLLQSPMHFISGNLLAPIFAMGKRRAALKVQKAIYEQECYNYEKVVLEAFKEVRDCIVEFNKAKDKYELQLQLQNASKATMELAQLQYINGVIGYIDVLDAQRSYFDARIGLGNAIKERRIALVKLYKSLGGGW